MILPSKELLSEVFGVNITHIQDAPYNGVSLFNDGYTKRFRAINIYELLYKCKELIHSKGYVYIEDTRGYSKISKQGTPFRKFWEDDSFNPFRVVEACEWILKEEQCGEK